MEASFLPGEGKHDADLERIPIHQSKYGYTQKPRGYPWFLDICIMFRNRIDL